MSAILLRSTNILFFHGISIKNTFFGHKKQLTPARRWLQKNFKPLISKAGLVRKNPRCWLLPRLCGSINQPSAAVFSARCIYKSL
ncbi:MAG: hypothetical protein BCS36_03665 [Desulfovibrio sp. MES5]|uniref:hypothetical protein n=1 Tax=Desulfovibrio sp. MES5 TaxID=1899016 RepID=UPI000B9D446A|nr:hypothetical protein [Desulfovibrio sp. MES5]OXS30094.1 MAG: hypothetical protein BCS36_03665 [Desulfovibrio sp. MES5]